MAASLVWSLLSALCVGLLLSAGPACSQVTVGFSETSYTVVEGGADAMVTVEVTGTIDALVVVSLSTMNGTAVSGDDYVATMIELTFSATGSTNVTLNTINDDSFSEGDQFFIVDLVLNEMNTTFSGNVTVSPDSAMVIIQDDDAVTVGFSKPSYSVVEGEMVSVCVGFTMGTLQRTITVVISADASSEAMSMEYSGLGSVSFDSVDTLGTMRCITISATQDNLLEGNNESLTLVLSSDEGVLLSPNTSTVVITMATVSLVGSQAVIVLESVGTLEVCFTIFPIPQINVTVMVATSDGTATADSDYLPISMDLVFPSDGADPQCVEVLIIDDNALEAAETFEVAVTAINSTVAVVNGTLTVILMPDNEVVTVSVPTELAMEDVGVVSVCVTLMPPAGGLQRNVTVMVETQNGTALEGMDYEPLSGMVLTFSPGGSNETCVEVTLLPDSVLEGTETFLVVLTSSDPAVNIANNITTVTIEANGAVTFGFVLEAVSVDEGKSVDLCVNVTMGELGVPVTLDIVQTPAGVATVPANLTFPADSVQQCFPVMVPVTSSLVMDQVVMLSLATTAGDSVTLEPGVAMVTITVLTIGLERETYSVMEGMEVEVCATIMSSFTLESETTVAISTVDGSALANVDYIPLSNVMLTFGPNVTRQCVRVNTTNNSVFQGDKMFSVVLQAAEPNLVTLNTGTAQINITEDDNVTIGFMPGDRTVVEGSAINLTLGLQSGVLDADIPVTVMTLDLAATAGMDYTAVNEMLVLNSSLLVQSVLIMTSKDNYTDESSEVFSVRLTSMHPSPQVTVAPDTVNITIIDAPFISQFPINVFALLGETATFNVMAFGFNISYQWLNEGVDIAEDPRVEGATTATLTITNVTRDRVGGYSCRVSNSVANVTSSEAQLEILEPPMIVNFTGDTGVLNGSNITLSCTALSPDGAVNITWSTSNSTIDLPLAVESIGEDGALTSTVTLYSVDVQFNGDYTCTASNRLITDSETLSLYVITIIGVQDVEATTGTNATFFCDAIGHEDLTYAWGRAPMGIFTFERFLGTTRPRVRGEDTNMLTFLDVSRVDTMPTSQYGCMVSLFGDLIGSAVGNLTTRGPTVTGNPVNTTVTMNDTLTLNCTAVNNTDAPNPLTFGWVRGATVLLNAVTEEIAVDNRTVTSRLIVGNVTREDAGEYDCTVHNRMLIDKERSTAATVTVNFAPDVLLSLDGVASPVFNYNVTIGDNIEVACSAMAVPALVSLEIATILGGTRTVLATSNGTPLADNSTSPSLLENGTVYECVAVNDIGQGSSRITVIAQDVPEMVNHSDISVTVNDLLRVTLSWTAPGDNNAPITAYNISACALEAGTCVILYEDLFMPGPVAPGGRISRQEEYRVDSTIRVRITAINAIGMGAVSEQGFDFSTATALDGSPINEMEILLTPTSVAYRWETSTLGQGSGIVLQQYNFTVTPAGSDEPVVVVVTQNQGGNTYGAGMSGLESAQLLHSVSIFAVFSNPPLISEPLQFNFTTPSQATPLLNTPGSTETSSATLAIIRWPRPDRTFLRRFSIEATTVVLEASTGRRKRQTSPEIFPVNDPNAVSFSLPTRPFSSITVLVFAEYEPDGSPVIRVQLIDPLTVISPEGAAEAPRQLMVVPLGFNGFSLSWELPSVPNGIISDHQITFQKRGGAGTVRTGSSDTVFALTGLTADTAYEVGVRSLTGDRGSIAGAQIQQTVRTAFGVNNPVVTRFRSSSAANRFTLSIGFTTTYGPISFFQVVVTRRNQARTGDFDTSTTASPSTEYYVAVQRDYTSTQATSQVQYELGTGRSEIHRDVTYTNLGLQEGTEYYVFIRAFSRVNMTIFNDSAYSEVISLPNPLNTVAIIVPIAAVAVVLLIILVVLLLFAYLTMRGTFRRHVYSPKGTVLLEDGKRRNKGGAAMELRRTRLFSPVLNVGSPDVFTSAGQPTTLICEASGTPAPEVTWTHNDQPLDKERFIQLADGSLFINDTDLQDEGTYVVRAVNLAGDAEVSVRMTVLRPIPPEPDADHAPIKVGEFSEKIALVRAEDDEGLEDEYADVELDWTFSTYSAKLNINKNKNRYINIIPYDHARVVLSLQDNTPGSDYINASFVDAHQRPNGYIASQGPIPSTFPDFWRMIWELDSPTIVMVTNLKEEDKIKCHQYWPSYGTTTYGNIQVTLKEVENLAEYSIRTFNVSPLAGQSRVPMPVREVRQFHFLVWPDHGVPQYATNLLSFRKRVLKYHPEKRGPMAVHCSAGVGRTGTFITIDYMLKQMEAEGTIDIFNFVRHMRYRRNYMVQTSPQYVFIHDALLESIMCGDNSIKAPEMRTKVKQMQEVVQETGKSIFQTQFDTLITASPPDDDFDCSVAQLPDNVCKNRCKIHLPANDYRVVLSTDGDQSDYICASYVDNYRERNAFIVTQAPMADTVADFWRMMWETKSAAIVMLTELTEGDQEMCMKYWPSGVGDPSAYGGYQVELSEEEKDRGSYITRRFKLSPLNKPQESCMVSQFHFTKWTKTTPPTDSRPMIDLIDELQRVQRKSGNMPITVHCDDGVSRTGAFCALYSVLERVKTEQIVDVFQAIKTLRIQRAGLLGTIEEYEFVHRAVIEFLDTFSDYQNFK